MNRKRNYSKKIISVAVSAMMAISMFPMTSFADEIKNGIDIVNNAISESFDRNEPVEKENVIEVPEEGLVIKNGTYYGISKDWFERNNPDKEVLKLSISVPDSVTIIYDDGFRDAWSQKKQDNKCITNYNYDSDKTYTNKYIVVNINFSNAKSLKNINNQAAMNCPLTGELDLSNTKVETIGKSAFSGCTGLTGVVLPNTLRIMGYSDGSSGSVFNGCAGLKYVRTNGGKEDAVFELPGNLEVIGKQCFYSCTGFPENTTVIIPASVGIVGSEAFYKTDKITTIIVKVDDASNYNGGAFKGTQGNHGFGKRLVVFNNSEAKKTFSPSGFTEYKNSITYEFKLHYGKNPDSKVESKLWGQAVNICKNESEEWYVNEDYEIPEAPSSGLPDGYAGGWVYNDKILSTKTVLKPSGDDLYLEIDKVLKEPNIEFIVDGEKIECEDTYPKLKLTNDKEHTIGVYVSHDIEKAENPDVTVEFEYEWTDVCDGGDEGPRMKEDGFGRYDSVENPDVKNTITINGAKDERTNAGNYSDKDYGDGYYLLEVYGYSTPKDGGQRKLFYKSASTVIGSDPDRTTNTAYLFDVVTYTPIEVSAKNLSIYRGNGLPTDFDLDLKLDSEEKIETIEVNGESKKFDTEEEALKIIKDCFNVDYINSKGVELTDDSVPGVHKEELSIETDKELEINGKKVSIDNEKKAGKLTIRTISDVKGIISGENVISAVVIGDIDDIDKSKPAAIVKNNTNYYTNDDDERKIEDKSGISLLDDSLLGESYGADYEEYIINKTNKWGESNGLKPASGYENKYNFYYFDLVDENNGNAWVSASNKDSSRTGENVEDTVTLYIPYPEGTDKNTDLQVIYYNDLHREYGENGSVGDKNNILASIDKSEIKLFEKDKIKKYENGITIPVEKAKFGPFAIVRQAKESGSSSGGGSGSYQESDIIGKDRYETAGLIADRIGYYNSVILVNANDTLADGLSAASLSGKENAPILLVKKDKIPEYTKKRIEKASTVYIIGEKDAISKEVENQLKDKKVIRIGGKNRIETSLKLAEYVGNYDEAFIVNGYTGEADAMSASAVAAKYKAPIILTNGKTSNYAKKSGVEYYAVGGKAVLDDKIVSKYGAKRFGGEDRYETNRLIINEFYKNSSKYYFTKGDPLVDALTVSLHAKDNGVVLVSKKSDNTILKGKDIVQVGGMPFSIFPIK
ncbi:hypothetical protein EXD82_09540 [Peptacetobacter hominis]|uniref:Cell wall-binding repeat-containing protein n=1 Tax=Peptacetobacter hominis TaxID=2743610 RepID=A0A544QT27_9FIRM|nr:cell wall-binding repeat-containing protein [Peptacetobacter hominis]TQQ83192.1 hypothetical protein EXD82_09540 [Peptacetobacter hominis]